MIGRLSGRLLVCQPGELLLDVDGVGYEVQIPLSTYYQMTGHGTADGVTLHVHTHVREDALQLFGFATLDERGAFEKLIAISGVGFAEVSENIQVSFRRLCCFRKDLDGFRNFFYTD